MQFGDKTARRRRERGDIVHAKQERDGDYSHNLDKCWTGKKNKGRTEAELAHMPIMWAPRSTGHTAIWCWHGPLLSHPRPSTFTTTLKCFIYLHHPSVQFKKHAAFIVSRVRKSRRTWTCGMYEQLICQRVTSTSTHKVSRSSALHHCRPHDSPVLQLFCSHPVPSLLPPKP